MKTLTVKGRYLFWSDGIPFFYLGDTAWELLHRLNREEIEEYMTVREVQGFTAVQTVALAEMDGLRIPNAYGRLPLCSGKDGLPNPVKPDTAGEYSYWDHVDFAVDCAARHGLIVTLLPAWGDKFDPQRGKGPMIFSEENAYAYGKWIGQRFAERWNIIWMLGGDRALDERTRPIIDRMAQGIRETDPHHLITFHPPGGQLSTDYVGDASYIDFHTAQTGHDVARCYDSDGAMCAMALASEKPYLDAEPRYEDHPACFDPALGYYWQAADVRQNAYWNLMAGVCGHTYGNHCVWGFNTEPSDYFPYHWREALTHPAAEQIGLIKSLRLRGDFDSFHPMPHLFQEHYAGEDHLAAAGGRDYAYVYTPLGLPITVNLSAVTPSGHVLRALWMNPRSGEELLFGIYPAEGENTFVPPTRGKGQDWVLILEKAE